MKATNVLIKKIINSTLYIFGITVLFVMCSKDRGDIQINEPIDGASTLKSGSLYSIKVTPNKNSIMVGDYLSFTGTVTQNGKGVKDVLVSIQDPMKQMTIANAVKTDVNGRFTYYVENMCPAKYNDMAGIFDFVFYIGASTLKSRISVSSKPLISSKLISVTNDGKTTYKVRLYVNKKDKGITTIAPGKTVNLLANNLIENLNIEAYVMDVNSKALWKAVFSNTSSYKSLITTFINPFYNNYVVSSLVNLSGISKQRSFWGVNNLYTDVVNKDYSLMGFKVSATNNVTHGVSTAANFVDVSGPGCETFLGFRAKCEASCSASVGLKVKFCIGSCVPIQPFADLGCGYGCSVEIASASCQLGSISTSASATYK